MHPKIWGKSFWTLLVYVGSQYPLIASFDDIHKMRRLIVSVGNVLPCSSTCRPNFYRHLQELPLNGYLATRNLLLEWLLAVYNMTLSEQKRSPVSMKEFLHKFYTISSQDRNIEIQKALYYVSIEYPIHPTFDEITNYRNFFTYLSEYTGNMSFAKHDNTTDNMLDRYLNTRNDLMKYVTFTYNIQRDLIGDHGNLEGFYGNFVGNFVGNKNKNDKSSLGLLFLMGTLLVGFQFLQSR